MEISSRILQDRDNNYHQILLSPMNSPKSNVSNNCMSSSNSNCIQIQTPPLTPKNNIPRSDNSNPYPTTFVQADTSTFKQVVQMLTGSSETSSTTSTTPKPTSSLKPSQHHQQQQQHQDPVVPRNFNIPPIKTAPKKQGFKLYERRNSIKNSSLMLNTIMTNNINSSSGFNSPRKHEILSPSLLDFPSLALSPVTPLNDIDPFDKSSSPSLGNSSEEEKAIAERGFYLHPSPTITTPRDSEPQLLPLFPLTSPRVSESPS